MKIEIKVTRFEVIDGKKTGKMLVFSLDPKEMAVYKTDTTLRKYLDELVQRSGVFKFNEMKDLKFNMKEFLTEWRKEVNQIKNDENAKQRLLQRANEQRITPSRITSLKGNEIFVFGSNALGQHMGGAARQAVQQFGAIMGVGHGIQGSSYAINTMSGINDMKEDISAFEDYAIEHPDQRFLVTAIGCGIAGYTPKQIAPLFKGCSDISNVTLPEEFWYYIK